MPRTGNTISSKSSHHKPMHSAAHGMGHDARLRKAKREFGVKARKSKGRKGNAQTTTTQAD